MPSIAVVWLRRDLRLEDNPALYSAINHHDKVLLVYIHQPEEEAPWAPGAASRWWLHHSLTAFNEQLKQHKAELVLRIGSSEQQLIQLCQESKASSVYWNRLYEPAAIERDKRIKANLSTNGIEVSSFNGALLREPWEILRDKGQFYKVYTPFSNQYFRLSEPDNAYPAPNRIHSAHQGIDSVNISALNLLPTINWDRQFYDHWQPGETGAHNKLERFLDETLFDYGESRDIPSIEGISRLSPHLHFGEISSRQIWHAVKQQAAINAGEDAIRPYLRQLIWRDFAHHLLYHLPHTPEQPFRESFAHFEWHKDDSLLDAWCRGQTGIPLVDAGMRELWQTGWMHNRARMLTASFLTKNGLIHWTEGAKWFWDTLVDADLANNTMGWQWVAGCGVDAAPYFRIFSPPRQGERFDSAGKYVRKWVPELANLPDKHIHQPWATPSSILGAADIRLGQTYPEPVLDLSATRKTALEKYRQMEK